MTSSFLQNNPFKVFTPEDMEAGDVHALFVHPFTDFNKVQEPGHIMLNGPRGCGKSMIFRYLLPDCQCLALNKKVTNIPFLAFLISIKNTVPNLTEFRRLRDRYADVILSEHLLAVFMATKVFQAISKLDLPDDESAHLETRQFVEGSFLPRLRNCGGKIPQSQATATKGSTKTARSVFEELMTVCDELYSDVVQYGKRLAFQSSMVPRYDSALCGYTDFLLPILQELTALPFLPSVPIYLLVDDADYLSHPQTVALNSWISTRTQGPVSIKVSTQLRYKTYDTATGLPIQSPHDYQSIDIADIYTTRRGRYLSRIEEIISLRLKNSGIEATPQEFFPCDVAQERKIENIADGLRRQWPQSGRGNRPSDDAIRYARPEYIRSLGGISKSRSTYSYAGFEQLVHISSGLVRYFLESAALMYDQQRSLNSNVPVAFISEGIQNQVVRGEADRLMLSEFQRIEQHGDVVLSQMGRLFNLIQWLGGTFFIKLISKDSERRVFSVAISGQSSKKIDEVFDLGVRYAYFHRSSIGNKDGTGRTRLYVLTRRLAPYFTLDPTTFSGYLWISRDLLSEAMENPDRVVRRMKNRGVSDVLESGQLTLFD